MEPLQGVGEHHREGGPQGEIRGPQGEGKKERPGDVVIVGVDQGNLSLQDRFHPGGSQGVQGLVYGELPGIHSPHDGMGGVPLGYAGEENRFPNVHGKEGGGVPRKI